MSTIESLKLRVRDSISIARDLLTKMTTTTSHPDPAGTHAGYINRMTSLTDAVATELLKTRPTCRDLNDMELRDFTTSMIDISQRASTFYTNLGTRMDPTQVVEILTANTKLQKATQDIQGDYHFMKLGTPETAKCIYANLTLDHDYLLEDVMEQRNTSLRRITSLSKG